MQTLLTVRQVALTEAVQGQKEAKAVSDIAKNRSAGDKVGCARPRSSVGHEAHSESPTSPNVPPASGHVVDTGPQIDPDLQAVMDAWASLPAVVRVGILAMVDAAKCDRPDGGAA